MLIFSVSDSTAAALSRNGMELVLVETEVGYEDHLDRVDKHDSVAKGQGHVVQVEDRLALLSLVIVYLHGPDDEQDGRVQGLGGDRDDNQF
jgi:hypothetical protein